MIETKSPEQITQQVRPVLQTDENGFIISDSDISKITSPWKEAVNEMKDILLKEIGEDKIHSIYVVGSVSRGLAKERESDIDTITMVKRKEGLNKSWISEAQDYLKMKYPFSTKFEFSIIPLDEFIKPDEYFKGKLILKTSAVCIYGKDISQDIKPIKADTQTAYRLSKNLDRDIETAKMWINKRSESQDIKWIMKRVVRSGYMLVMDKEKTFTVDLQPSYEAFAKHYPNEASQMKKALELATDSSESKEAIIKFLNEFGNWLVKEIEKKFPEEATITNPHLKTSPHPHSRTSDTSSKA